MRSRQKVPEISDEERTPVVAALLEIVQILHEENQALRDEVSVDYTGAWRQGKNGYCTHIGNEMFAWFQSTAEKGRMNFLRLVRAGADDYALNADALEYMEDQKLPQAQRERLINVGKIVCEDEAEWNKTLGFLGITEPFGSTDTHF